MWCDFHLHSDHSDGEFAPARVVDMVADAGIGVMALTDHDTTAGHEEARARAKARGLTFVGGIEMTAYAEPEVVHVLGLRVSTDDGGLARANAIAMDVWSDNQRRWVESLQAKGMDASVERDIADRPIRLPVLIERLCSRGVDDGDPGRCYARFKEFFAALPPEAYARLPSPAGAAAAIRAAGGVAILAHPERLRSNGLADRLLGDVDGLEALYAPYEPPAREALRRLALSRGKLYSCGSDYHGYFNGAYVNPRFEAPQDLLTRLLM
jgi:predicted metal-dependent phosphoesterase TrpH